jgi:para-aminobenzoate synthetase component 1
VTGALASAARRAGRPGRVLLHSARDDDGCGRTSYVASDPVQTIEARGRRVVVRDASGAVQVAADADPFDVLEELSATRTAIGYLGYDLGRLIEACGSPVGHGAVPDTPVPDMWFGLYDDVERFDAADEPPPATGPAPVLGELRSEWSDADYRRAVRRALDYIEAGDVYQVNLARRLRATIERDGDALAIYAALLAHSPCAYGALIETPDARIVSGSPERFLSREPGTDRLETRPIKGTRRRTGDPARDAAAAADLAADAKERAEHLMIVDLERNDLGRVAVTGSVRVDSFARIVELPTLYHAISTVSCTLRPDAGAAAILRATFPGGSITGAPKVRAMQIIDELEPTRRAIYTGAIGRLAPNGAIDLAIAIRTAVLTNNTLHLHVGGGIVADSTPDRELEETEEKAAAWGDVVKFFSFRQTPHDFS